MQASATGETGNYSLSLGIEIKVQTDMPHMAPSLEIVATCGAKSDTKDAFFMALSNATRGTEKFDTVEFFRVDNLSESPLLCEFRLQLSEGQKRPDYFCYHDKTTKAGRCPKQQL